MISRLTLALVISFIATLAIPGTGKSLSDDKREVHGANQASTGLMKELVEIYKSDSYKRGVIEVELENDNLYEWNVKMFIKDPKCRLYGDLKRMKSEGKEDHVMIRLSFARDYPNSPPFVRVVYPIMTGLYKGTFCLHLLTRQGWYKGCTSETLIAAIIQLMMDPLSSCRVNLGKDSEKARESYSLDAARQAFEQIEKSHGWDHSEPKLSID